MQRTRNSVEVLVPGHCTLGCAVCDCGVRGRDGAVQEALDSGAERVILRGCAETRDDLADLVRSAREAGKVVVLRTNALAFERPERARHLASLGVDAVLVPIFSHHPTPHDRLAGREGALVGALRGIRSLVSAGLDVEIEVPLLDARLQNLDRLLDTVRAAAPRLEHVRIFLPHGRVPGVMTPPAWDEARPRLEAFLHRCVRENVRVQIDPGDGIPQCAIPTDEDLWPIIRFDPRGKAEPLPGAVYPEGCQGCAVRKQCSGVVQAYASAHGNRGLVPFGRRPKRMYEQRTTPRPRWTELRKRAAANVERLVLRPTVNCNQDCPFCSANETSSDIWPDPDVMLRRIARVGRTGVKWLSFSGGEPMLSKHITSFIQAGRKVGIPRVELVTNAVLLASEKRADAVCDAGLTDAFVSLHAHDEALSRYQTRKVGDFDRTVRGIENLLERGVTVVLNHVINTRNYRFLPRYVEFVQERFGGRTPISFAYITPQFQALERIDLVPRMADALPYLRVALHRAMELKQPFHIGSRQGIPPCQLGEFEYFSDILGSASEAGTEDAHQKIRAPICDTCAYSGVCTGVWKPYADLYGLDELRPIRREAEHANPTHLPTGHVPFDDIPERFRHREAEEAFRAGVSLPEAGPDEPEEMGHSRPERVLLFGTGNRARVLAAEVMRMPELLVGSVASPHAPDGDLSTFGNAPAYRDGPTAVEEQDPDAVVVASNTGTHLEGIRLAVDHGLPVLVEKPLVPEGASTDELRTLAAGDGVRIMPAHQVLFAAGLHDVLDGALPGVVTYVRTIPGSAPDVPRLWSADAVFQLLYHALVLVGRAAGGGVARVDQARITGRSRPSRLDARLRYGEVTAEVSMDFDGARDTLRLGLDDGRAWTRVDRDVTVTRGGVTTAVERRRGEVAAMLAAFHGLIQGSPPPEIPTVQEALDVAASARAVTSVLAEAEPRLARAPNAPRHAQTLRSPR